MTYKVWVITGFTDGDCDVEIEYITSKTEKEIVEIIENMGSDVLAFKKVGGVDVSEGLQRTSPPSPLSPLLFEVTS